MSPLPLDLNAEVITADGARYRWGPNEGPRDRLQNFSFRTKIGEGFSDAAGKLPRRIDLDYPDLNLVDTVVFTGADGSVAYEGRVASMPRELGDSHSIAVNLAGWISHASDMKFTEIYVDRDRGAWGPMSRARKIATLTSNITPFDPEQATDPTDSASGVATVINGSWVSPFKPMSEAWYDAGPNLTIGRIDCNWKREGANPSSADTFWSWIVASSSDDKVTAAVQTSNLRAPGPGTVTFATGQQYRYGLLQLFYNSTPAGGDGTRFAVDWYKLAVYGNHGLTLTTGETGEPPGVTASDVVKNIAQRWCPKLNTNGVQDTTYIIQHLAFKDPTNPYDAFLEVNKYHLWHLGVWEDRTLTYRPYDLTDYMWEIRMDEPGTTVNLQGPSVDDLHNGIAVTYTDLLTGIKNRVTPDGNAELQDQSPENPWNEQGINHWHEIELSTPTLQAQAMQIGKAALASKNRPKTPGTITARGYIRDRAGNEQPVWKVRAGDTISLTNFPNDAPRLIHETSYDDDSKTVTLSIDAPAQAIDAILDRVATAVTASGFA